LKLTLTDRELHQGVVILAFVAGSRRKPWHETNSSWCCTKAIKHNGQHSKPYHSQTAALKDAIDQAHEVHKKGGLSQVLVQREDLQFREERTFGKDPYPRAG
jgi:hypothetical protein